MTVIAAIVRALKAAHLPPMDERLKSIVGRQILTLHKGGWPIEEIERAAIDLALAWDEGRGHNRLTHLAQRMRVMDADRKHRAHVAQMAIGKGNAEELRALIGHRLVAGKPHPNTHDYIRGGPVPGLCAICEGPSGVHVKPRVEVNA
jgi:hypothetical protein